MIEWVDPIGVKKLLRSEGWVSPDTYTNDFEEITDGSAVYLFLLYDKDSFESAVVAYVGMSKHLKQRLSGHNILREIDSPGYWVMRWFKPTPPTDLRDVEGHYIQKFDPPWNIIGRRRGVDLI